jgi:phosphoribosylanthranilate isomerase
MTAVKICGITRSDDAVAAARLGAHALGFVFYAGSARNVEPARAAQIMRALPPFVTTVGLFVNPAVDEIRSVLAQARLDLLQFHGDETPQFCRGFGTPYLKALRVRAGSDLLQYARLYGNARGLLLDAYVADAHGGTGVTFDWSLIPRNLPLPVVLSGGLNADNVAGAIRSVRPWAVDVSSGVEASPGVKDAQKMAAFFQGVRDADV